MTSRFLTPRRSDWKTYSSKNRDGELTEEEQAELDSYFRYRHVMILLKASARRAINRCVQ